MFDTIAGDVADLVCAAGDRFVLPRYGALADEDIATKTSPTDLVTVADREAEAWLTPRLRSVVDAVVIGEEACGEDPSLRERAMSPLAWTIDPVDGTNNFVKAKDRFCSMVALLEKRRARQKLDLAADPAPSILRRRRRGSNNAP